MNNNIYLDIAPEVDSALKEGRPVVALESTIISHGMPYPQNVETAVNVENIIRSEGAVPATIAVIGGKMKVGLSRQEIEYLGKKGMAVTKASRRDLPSLAAKKADGATPTVCAFAPFCPSPAAARPKLSRIISALRCRTSSWWVTALTMPRNTATCPMSAC